LNLLKVEFFYNNVEVNPSYKYFNTTGDYVSNEVIFGRNEVYNVTVPFCSILVKVD